VSNALETELLDTGNKTTVDLNKGVINQDDEKKAANIAALRLIIIRCLRQE
jgi:hypothetical protein